MKNGRPSQNDRHNLQADYSTTTTKRGRRGIVHLWTAARAIAGAELTLDDQALIREAMHEIADAIGGGDA